MKAVNASALIASLSLLLVPPALGASVPKPTARPLAPSPSQSANLNKDDVPKPRLRPVQPAPLRAPVLLAIAVPIPKPRPGLSPKAEPAPSPPAAPDAKDKQSWPSDQITAERAQCGKLLESRDIAYKALDPIGHEGGCGAPAPVLVTRVAGVKLAPPATLTCNMAAALHDWLKNDVQPAARKRLGTEVTEIRTATSYSCRRRNNASSGKMSEHSKANALDMAGFSFAKTAKVAVGGQGNWGDAMVGPVRLTAGGSFLGAIRLAACSHFTTVLGPGSDPYHGDHFHVDVLQRKGGYRICQ
ncbi:extensin family protein [Aestuariivirga sp.]|uniref:extensin-like domain-containing protein n=1 Tax=Aestuariivirga sp. TaxID=2650926 RepID=UPI003BAD88B8